VDEFRANIGDAFQSGEPVPIAGAYKVAKVLDGVGRVAVVEDGEQAGLATNEHFPTDSEGRTVVWVLIHYAPSAAEIRSPLPSINPRSDGSGVDHPGEGRDERPTGS
jgi:hypothetical protein